MRNLSNRWLLCVAATVVFTGTQARAASAAPVPIVVELFTSEGCSDCPPADAFLKTLDSTQPVPGALVIVLEEHVDYWDDQGWKDPFSSHALTVRQENYAYRLRLASPYTPQMIVDGSYQFVGSDRRGAIKAFDSAHSMPKAAVRVSAVRLEKQKLFAHVECDAAPSKADVVIALAAEHAESQVLRGENGGQHLEHVAIISELTNAGKVEKGQNFSKDIAINAKSFALPGRVIVLLQEPNQGRIVGAVQERLQN